MRSLAVVLAISLVGCSLDRAEVGGPDQPARDAGLGGVDGDPGLDVEPLEPASAHDAGAIDGGRPIVDGGQDAHTPTTDDTGPPRRQTCDERYGDVPAYERCGETETTCELYAASEPEASCDVICASRGGACTSARHDGASSGCGPGGEADCAQPFLDVVCTCTLP